MSSEHASALPSRELILDNLGGSLPKYYDDRLKQAMAAKKKTSAKRGPVSIKLHVHLFITVLAVPLSSRGVCARCIVAKFDSVESQSSRSTC